MTVPPEGAWVLRGDRGITYAKNCPENSTLPKASGGRRTIPASRWSRSRRKRPRDLGLKIGDTVTVNVLGRNVTARIANFRQLNGNRWRINFVMVFSPNTFAGAPHAWLATLMTPDATAADEAAVC